MEKMKWVPFVGPCQDMPLSKQATCIGISARGLLGEGKWRESNSKRPWQRRDKKRHERETRSQERKEVKRRKRRQGEE